MNLPFSKLQHVLQERTRSFDLGQYISQGFEVMNKQFGLLLAFMLLTTVVQMIPIIGIVASLLLAPVFQVGYGQFVYTLKRENKAEFAEFFKGFNKFGHLLATFILSGIIGLLAILPGLAVWFQAGMWEYFSVIMEDYPFIQDAPDLFSVVDSSMFMLGLLLMLVGGLAIAILFSWALYIVWFYDAGPLEALNASRKLIARNWGLFILFLILAGIIASAGVLLCFVGILYTAPAMACAQFFAFADQSRLFEADESRSGSDPIDHFIA